MSEGEDVSDEQLAQLAAAAERALRSSNGEQISVTGIDPLTKRGRRNLVARLSINGTSAYRTVVAKQQCRAPAVDVELKEGVPMLRELAALELLNDFPDRIAPTLLASDTAQRLIVIEDLGDAKELVVINGDERDADSSLVQPLMGGTQSTAESAILRFATCLGQMHAGAAGYHDRFAGVCDRLGVPEAGIRSYRANQVQHGFRQSSEVLGRLGVKVTKAVDEELLVLAERLKYPGKLNTLIHGDPCPDNCTYVDNDLRLIDFEFAHFGHAFLDASYFRAAFPSCWCCLSVPSPIVQKAEKVYRDELVKGIPEVEDDDTFREGLYDGCITWALIFLPQLAKLLEDDTAWGVSSVRARSMYRLKLVSEMAAPHLPAIADFCGNLSDVLSSIWRAEQTLPQYPAFAN